MKFSHSLQFNAVPDWADRYIADAEAVEESPLLDLTTRANAIFIPALDKELTKINSFYLSKENELFKEVTNLIQDFAVFENLEDSVSIRSNSFSLGRSNQSMDKSNKRASTSRLHRMSVSESVISNVSSDEDENTPITRITSGNLKSSYLNNVVNDAYVFKDSTFKNMEERILKVQEIYANICTNANMDAAMRELKTHLREFIVWERNTVWRDIIGLERKSQAVGIKAPVTIDQSTEDKAKIKMPFAAHHIFSAMFSPVIMLLLGGFAIAAALSKYHIAKVMATFLLSKAGTRPSMVLLVNMFVATFLSMWISNVAAPVFSFARCLILGIALASNVGGMASPISSPQNIIAIEYINPSPTWGQWFIVAIPLCIIINILVWLVLLFNYKPSDNSLIIHPIRLTKDPWSGTQIFVMVVTGITIALWCTEKTFKSFENFFGDMGIIAVIPLVAFFGTGILTKEDFNNFLWTVIVLAMGGIALGAAVRDSGLLKTIAESVQLLSNGLNVWQALALFSSLVLVVATFISHTVGALIILPIVAEVGLHLSDPHPNLLVMVCIV
ncbi:6950_t:CDS:2 [Racocetra fulgida]|uniref:6950_t:CDS:1 n=1 Tax=Racocetra fulgida TaxID=60492 RepID=A0A9N9BB45_9GLOM|nr:6950_t:CDS:2 [Racocetra fulgida]